MSFWGEMVLPEKPCTLKLAGDHKRLRISQATFGEWIEGTWRPRAILYCAVGSKPPVGICSLSSERCCCMLDLEFEESKEDVVFSVRDPRGIHLSGYYVMPLPVPVPVPTDHKILPFPLSSQIISISSNNNDDDLIIEVVAAEGEHDHGDAPAPAPALPRKKVKLVYTARQKGASTSIIFK